MLKNPNNMEGKNPCSKHTRGPCDQNLPISSWSDSNSPAGGKKMSCNSPVTCCKKSEVMVVRESAKPVVANLYGWTKLEKQNSCTSMADQGRYLPSNDGP